MINKGLGEILNDLEEALLNSNDFSSKEYAKETILNILDMHGSYFILDILEKKGVGNFKKSHLVKAVYSKLIRKYPQLKKEKVREMVATHFGITDKAVQKHIYKGRIK